VKKRRGQLPFADERQEVKSHDDEAELSSAGAFLARAADDNFGREEES
jgi:hypothetical protein